MGPVIAVPEASDFMIRHSQNCKQLDSFLAEGKFDAQRLYDMMVEYFGSATVKATKRELEDYYSTSINRDLRTYFQMLDSRVSELKHAGQDREQMMLMQKQECFILANNFISDDPLPG